MATPRGCSAHARLMRSSSFSAASTFRLLHAHPFSARDRDFLSPARALTADGPSCLYVGPVETATKERLEELYQQARESYYDGNPLIIDDMFDKIELKLRLYGSKSVVKYPRCSLRRQSTYADAEEDPSQEFALASIWLLLLAFGSTAIFVPVIYVISLAFADNISSRYFFYSERSTIGSLEMVNKTLILALGCLVGFPLAYASTIVFQAWKTLGLWQSLLGPTELSYVNSKSSSEVMKLY